MKKGKNKQLPKFNSDEELEQFVDRADLSEYDFSGLKPMRFEYAPKDASITLRMPSALLSATKALAEQKGISYQKLIRASLEKTIEQNLAR